MDMTWDFLCKHCAANLRPFGAPPSKRRKWVIQDKEIFSP